MPIPGCGARCSARCPRARGALKSSMRTLCQKRRAKSRGLDAFVLAGQQTVVVIKQGTSLRQAQFGDAFDQLVLASVIWQQMSHAEGADESSALEREQHLWRRLVVARRVDASLGLAYIARLDETSGRVRPPPAVEHSPRRSDAVYSLTVPPQAAAW